MKIVSVVGARPQFIKSAPVSTALAQAEIIEVTVYTGQHSDDRMAAIFFRELNLRPPAYSLGISGGNHGEMTGRMLEAIERVLLSESPDCVLVYGDTNTTLAGALAAAKLGIPVAHVEAGLRSYRQTMPEEINRRITDHVSSILLCPTDTAVNNLRKEGIYSDIEETGSTDGKMRHTSGKQPLVVNVGDVMVDALNNGLEKDPGESIPSMLKPGTYALLTLHRAESTDDHEILRSLVYSIRELADVMPVLFPIHPRTGKKLKESNLYNNLSDNDSIMIIDPMDHVSFVHAQRNARVIITDSGGVQKEACILGVPCLTLRDETEWPETVTTGWNELLGCPPRDVSKKALKALAPTNHIHELFGDGHASFKIVKILKSWYDNKTINQYPSAVNINET